MKKALLKLLLLLIPGIIITLTAVLLPPNESFRKSLFFSLIDKNKLLETTPAPRVIFIGGSNLSFGLNSKLIHDSLGINPVNTGIHASLGLKYMLKNTAKYIRENDIIIVSPEYQQFYQDYINGEIELLSTIIDIAPGSLNCLDYKQYYSLIRFIPKYFQTKINGVIFKSKTDTVIGIYDRKAFNSYGDAYIHWNLAKENVAPFAKIAGSINEDALQALINFRNIVLQRKAWLYITFPCYQDISYNISRDKIEEVAQKLRDNRFNLLSEPERYMVPDSFTFNTPYHLTKQGVDLRTNLLIEDIKKIMLKNN